jgi:hypothetical protein
MSVNNPLLIFIDTNIMLDFYRVRGGDASLGLLDHVDKNHDKIITTYQVEMEYKKNRHSAIFESLSNFNVPQWSGLQVPAFLREAQPTKMMEKGKKEIKKQAGKIKNRIVKVLDNPSQTDPVYKAFQRLFRVKGDIHLGREKKLKHSIRRLALKRFVLGYPPRKLSDTSYGDAINWEWIIYCANIKSSDVIIVSRDSDYGSIYDSKGIINDWLSHEFKERVSMKKTVTLTNRLAEAFKRASIRVSQKEEDQEKDLIARLHTDRFSWPSAELARTLNQLRSTLPLESFKVLQEAIEPLSKIAYRSPFTEYLDSIQKKKEGG